MGTSQIATQACDFRPERADGHCGRRVSRALGHHRQHQRLNHLVSRVALVRNARIHGSATSVRQEGTTDPTSGSDRQREALAVLQCDTHF